MENMKFVIRMGLLFILFGLPVLVFTNTCNNKKGHDYYNIFYIKNL